MSQSDLINKPELSNTTEENHLTEILREIQATPKEYWTNLLQIMRVFRESVTFKPENFNHSQSEIQGKRILFLECLQDKGFKHWFIFVTKIRNPCWAWITEFRCVYPGAW